MSLAHKQNSNSLSLNKKYSAVVLAVLILLAILVYFKINDSSIGLFCNYFPIGCESGEYVFKSRPIRSDEWIVLTPYILSQHSSGFLTHSNLVGESQFNPILGGGAYSHWSTIFKPSYLGQFFLDSERAYSFTKIFGISTFVLVFFLLFRKLKIPQFNSLVLAVSIYFSPFIQWWSLSTTVVYPLSLLVLILYFLDEKSINIKKILFYSIIGCYLFSITLHQLYPPFQITLLLLVAFAACGLALNHGLKSKVKLALSAIIVVFISLLLSGLLFYKYYTDFQPEFTAITSSSYPGKRISEGGDFALFKLFSGFYNIQLLNDAKPMGNINQSEASGFFNIILFVIPLLIISEIISRAKYKKNDWVVVLLLTYLIIILGWMIIGYPHWFASFSLLERVPAKRAEIGLGVGGLILLTYSIYVYKYQSFIKYLKPIVVIFGFAVVFYGGLYLRDTFPTFISNINKIFVISILSGSLIATAVYQKKLLFAVLFLFFSLISAGSVHPLRSGMNPLINSELITEVRLIQEDVPGRWAAYYSGVSPLLYANNIPTATGVFLYPQLEFWRKLDSKNQYMNIWNRYAHVSFITPEKNKDEIEFLLTAQDSFNVVIDPCHSSLQTIGVKYIVSPIELKADCLERKDSGNYHHEFYIYEILK